MQCLYKLVDKAIIYDLVLSVKSVLSKDQRENSQPQSGSGKFVAVSGHAYAKPRAPQSLTWEFNPVSITLWNGYQYSSYWLYKAVR